MRDLAKNERNSNSAIIVDFIRKTGEKPVNSRHTPIVAMYRFSWWKGSRSLIAARGFKSLLLRKKTESHQRVAFCFFCYEVENRTQAPRTARAKTAKRVRWTKKRAVFVTATEERDREGSAIRRRRKGLFKSLLLRSDFLMKNPYKSAVLGVLFLFVKSIKVRYCGVLTSSDTCFSVFLGSRSASPSIIDRISSR